MFFGATFCQDQIEVSSIAPSQCSHCGPFLFSPVTACVSPLFALMCQIACGCDQRVVLPFHAGAETNVCPGFFFDHVWQFCCESDSC